MTDDKHASWRTTWLDSVASGAATMSQRAVSSIEKHGGMAPLVAEARARGVHLVQLTDDKGKALVAASTERFETLC
jgi:hypothetical protein